MADLEIPNFGELLREPLQSVSDGSRAGLIARLERVAAGRYREWASQCDELAEGLMACAAREDEIADRVEKMSPVLPEDEDVVAELLERARDLYAAVFEGYTVREQITIQAHAERQGSWAWRGFAAQTEDPDRKAEFMALAELEIASADFVDQAFGIVSTDGRSFERTSDHQRTPSRRPDVG